MKAAFTAHSPCRTATGATVTVVGSAGEGDAQRCFLSGIVVDVTYDPDTATQAERHAALVTAAKAAIEAKFNIVLDSAEEF